MSEELMFLLKIVKNAAKISQKEFEVHAKGLEHDLVTNLDFEIEQYLIDEIKKKYPNFGIISEEYNSSSQKVDNCFIIDPIDGTINFANSLPFWAIQVACVKNGETVASVINMPKLNELYYADLNGAYLNGQRINVKEVPTKNALYVVDGDYKIKSLQNLEKYSLNSRAYGGVCVSMSFVACGRLHGAVYNGNNLWDYEPGFFICKMAGASTKSCSGFHAVAMNDEFLRILEQEIAEL